jgi:hypothetical protein
MSNGLFHGWRLSILQALVGGVVLALLALMVLPAINGFFGDWKKSWSEYAQQKGHDLRLFWKLYRVSRRNRREAFLIDINQNAVSLVRYLAFPKNQQLRMKLTASGKTRPIKE